MRLKTLIAVAATLAVVGLIIWQVAGAVHRTFGLPAGVAQVAKSTPTYQHGLTLLGIQNVSPDGYYSYADLVTPIRNSGSHSIEADTGLWVKMPSNLASRLTATTRLTTIAALRYLPQPVCLMALPFLSAGVQQITPALVTT